MRFLALLFCLCVVALSSAEPPKPAEKDDPRFAQAKIVAPEGFEVKLWAAEPQLVNPVAFCFDEKGRCYVAETHKLHKGVIDIRNHMNWLDDDLACRTVADRLAFMKRRPQEFAKAGERADRIIRLADTKGQGRADESIIVADDFHAPESGLGAGVLVRGDTLWFTNIPDLWKLKLGPDGKATEQKALATGFGVHFGFIGHDLHGLTMGPDGKLYFSIGDRGAVIANSNVSNPDSGAVFRCNPDGSDLELFATGLRNPQELAFDDFGNLFTVDNNSDAGDQVRVSYLIDGGDYGWRIGYQFFEQPRPRAAWMSERMYDPVRAREAAFIVPCVANMISGPSGLVHYPGVGLPEKYADSFFVCDFHGGSSGSGVVRFKLEPQGASFKVKEHEKFVTNVLATDVDFGPDGAMYMLDWTEGWDMPGKGRIWRVTNGEAAKQPEMANAKNLLAMLGGEMSKQQVYDAHYLLDHADQRVRWAALQRILTGPKFEGQTDGGYFSTIANSFGQFDDEWRGERVSQRRKIMTLWGTCHFVRDDVYMVRYFPKKALDDQDAEIRALALRVLGETTRVTRMGPDSDKYIQESLKVLAELADKAIAKLADPSPRVRFFACQALGKLKHKPAVPAILKMLEENNDQDSLLRSAGYIALARIDDRIPLRSAIKHKSAAVRRAVCVALRRLGDTEIAEFLDDADPSIVKEAARAICDVPIPKCFGELARVKLAGQPELTQYAVLQANFVAGEKENAECVATAAATKELPELVRYEALDMLGAWARPNGKDRFTGLWRPLAPRDLALLAAVSLRNTVFEGPPRVVRRAVDLCYDLHFSSMAADMIRLAHDERQPVDVREACLRSLRRLDRGALAEVSADFLRSKEPKLRAAALSALTEADPKVAMPRLRQILDSGVAASREERQGAIQALGRIRNQETAELLRERFQQLLEGKIDAGCHLDLTEAYRKSGDKDKGKLLAERQAQLEKQNKDLAPWLDCLEGGDAERGKQVFLKQELTCLKCHKLDKDGGDVGPELTHIAKDPTKTRLYLLESIARPNAQIAKGYDSVAILTTDGKLHSGVLKSEDAKEVRIVNAEGKEAKTIVIAKDKIEQRQPGKSAMPDDLIQKINPRELRDLMEFLATRK